MFGTWLRNQNKRMRSFIWVGLAAICWAIWRCQNDVIFNKLKTNSIMQIIFRGAFWLRFWAPLQCDEQAKAILSTISKKLEIIALDISNKGWKHLYSLL
jgi:RsiW-degrading membrane proteinase PrsW (M82 family)